MAIVAYLLFHAIVFIAITTTPTETHYGYICTLRLYIFNEEDTRQSISLINYFAFSSTPP